MKIDLRARPFYLDDEAAAWVEHTRDAMTVEDKVGQLFCVLFKQAVPSELEYVLGILKPGGCMYRVVSAERAVSFTQALQGALNIPPLIAANLEKGGNGIVEEGTLLGSPMEVAATEVAKLPVDDSDKFCAWCLSDFEYEGQTVFMAPASGFYTTPGSGINEVRIAYVLKKEDLTRALFILQKALEVYPGRTE